MTADPAASSDQAPEEQTPAKETPGEAPEEANKRRFREALQAKKGRRGQDHIDDGQQSTVHAHGPVEAKRVFRRKTG